MTDLYFNHEDLILNDNKNGGGFSVHNIMEKLGMSPIMTINTDFKIGGKNEDRNTDNVSDLFKNLAVPSWATMHHMQKGGYEDKSDSDNNDSDNSDSDIDEDLHEKLLSLVKYDENDKNDENNKNNNKKGGKNKIKSKKSKNNKKKERKNITKKNRLHH